MPTGTTKIILTGENARAIKAINEVASASEKSAAKSSSAFDKSTSKVGGAFTKLDRTLGSFGVPFTGALGVMGSKLEDTGKRSKGLKDNLSALGGGIALGAAAGFALIGGAAVKAALEGEKAHAQLVVAIRNAGQTEEEFGGKIDATSKHMADFGFQNDDVELSIARLTAVTKDTAKAIELQGLAADLAAGRHISLEEATSILVKVESGHVGALGRLGIATKDATGKTISQEEAIKKLSELYKGAAQAAAGTYAGKLAALQAKAANLTEELGNKLIPIIEKGVTAVLGTVDGFDKANQATGGWLGKLALAGAAVPVAVFAYDKLKTATLAIGGAYDRVAKGIDNLGSKVRGGAAATQQLTGTNLAGAAAAENAAVSAGRLGSALKTVGAAAIVATGAVVTLNLLNKALDSLGVGGQAAKVRFDTASASMEQLGRSSLQTGLIADTFGAHWEHVSSAIKSTADQGLFDKIGKAVDHFNEAVGSSSGATGRLNLERGVRAIDKSLADMAISGGESAGVATAAFEQIQAKALEAGVSQKTVNSAFNDFLKVQKELGSGVNSSQVAYGKLVIAEQQYASALRDTPNDVRAVTAAHDALFAASKDVAGVQGKVKDVVQAGAAAAEDNTGATNDQADATKELADELNGLVDAENAVLGSQLSLKESVFNVGKAVQDLHEKTLIAIKAKGKDQKANDDVTESQFSLSRQLLNTGQSAKKAAEDAEVLRQKNLGVENSSLVAKAGIDAEVSALRALEKKFPELKPEIESYIATLKKTPTHVTTTLEVRGYEDAVNKLRTVQNLIGSGTQTSVITFSGGGGRPYRARQHGGPVKAGDPYVVGEKGPELFVPKVSGTVVPNGASGTGRTVGNVMYLTINASGIGDRELGRQVVQALREYQRTRGPLNLKIAG